MGDVIGRLEALVGRLTAAGWLTRAPVQAALYDVPRHLFVPSPAWTGDGDPVWNHEDPERWLDLAYADEAIITQLDDGASEIATGQGRFTSSCSAPSTVVSLLELLDVEPGHRVLDVGTGTGWTAALLARLAGDGNVTSIEVDPQVAESAAGNLKDAGCTPRLVVGDGAEGWAQGALYDRVHATCAVSRIPYAWVAQTRPGGVIVTPYDPGFGSSHEVRLVVMPDGTAVGRFTGHASYMMLRSHRHLPWAITEEGDETSTTPVDPRTIGYAPAGADLAMGASLPGVVARGHGAADAYTLRLWSADAWATVTYEPGREVFPVRGDARLWEAAVTAYFRWVRCNSPGRERFGLSIGPDGGAVWLDRPGT